MSNVIEFKTSGPVFDGVAVGLSEAATRAAESAVASAAVKTARDLLTQNIQVSVTGAEPSSLHKETSSLGTIVTDNHAIVYGPWLEGTGSRNQTTRFKGYFSVRQAAQQVNDQAAEIAENAIAPFVKEMN